MKRAFVLSLSLFLAEALPAQDDVAVLAENCLYLGRKTYLSPGVYTASQLGIRDNSLSAFHLPKDMALQVFEYDRYLGRTETFYSSVSCLPFSWDNKVSSIKVYWVHDPGNQEGSSGSNLPPQGNKVIFYRDMKYSGMAREVGAGNFGSGTLGFLTDNISSVYIPPGQSVRVNDKSGRTQTFTSSISNLAQYGWDNKINSGFIEGNYNGGGQPPQGDKVIFYGDMKYTGMAREFNTGSFSPDALGFLLNNISSIYIPHGGSVKVYDRNGNNRTFTSSISDLAQYGWDNKISTGIITGTGGGTLPPQGDRVIFYRDMKYSGIAKDFNQGNFGTGSLGSLTNNISSVYIPYGWSVQVSDRMGRTQTFSASISNLAQYGWDNKIYSGFIAGNTSGGGQGGNNNTVNLYLDANYRGSVTPCSEGRINYVGLGAEKNISSIQLPTGFAIIIYEGQNLTGNNRTFTSSVSNLAAYGWDNKISSVYIFRM